MTDETTSSELSSILRFDPRWLIGDPVPDPFVKRLSPEAIRQLFAIRIEQQKAVLTAQLQALEKMSKVFAH